MFTAATKDKVSTVIVRQIREAILQGRLAQGESLPQEKELMAQFGVSKHSLREALRTLEGLGLITIRRGAGGGPVVREIDIDTARESFASFLFFQKVSIHDLTEVRKLLEPYLAEKAAESMPPETVQELCDLHEKCEKLYAEKKILLGAKEEIMFHVLLAKHAGNPILWIILDFVNNMLAQTKLEKKPGPDFSRRVIEAHRRILQAILDKKPDLAAKCMLEHLCEVEKDLAALP